MTFRSWKARLDNFLGTIFNVFPIGELKIKYLKHPILAIKRSYAYMGYAYCPEGGWDCEGRPGPECPDSCEGCPYHVYHKPFKPWLGGFILDYTAWGISLIAKSAVCFHSGHRLEDCSTAGPDSGNMDHRCIRCERYWSVTLY